MLVLMQKCLYGGSNPSLESTKSSHSANLCLMTCNTNVQTSENGDLLGGDLARHLCHKILETREDSM